jgi:hypothetical protein
MDATRGFASCGAKAVINFQGVKMAEIVIEKLKEKREKRAQSIAAMGLVDREDGFFRVTTPSLRGHQTTYIVDRDENGSVRCGCSEFDETIKTTPGFRCEHILAVKYAITAKNTEPSARKSPFTEIDNDNSGKTESRKSVRGEQEKVTVEQNASTSGHGEKSASEPGGLAKTQGDKTMKRNNAIEDRQVETSEPQEEQSNVLNFSSTLRELRKNVDPHLVRQREGWRDRNGNVQMVDYVEWHTVADILDETAPNWSHTVKDIREIGNIVTVTVAITIDGITREGIGTGAGQNELGIKKAEHDALKRAAVKFGIARDLYKKESDAIEREGSVPGSGSSDGEFPTNPVARNLNDLVTAKQLGMIRAIGREVGIDPDEECNEVMSCKTDELSKKAASAFIQHLQDAQRQKENPAPVPFRRAG